MGLEEWWDKSWEFHWQIKTDFYLCIFQTRPLALFLDF